MKILVACEHSGAVRDAFTAKGHSVTSCDFLPAETPGSHYQGDVLDILYDGWDMLIGHPPCTFLSTAGNGYFNIEKYGQKAINRFKKREAAMAFFMQLYNAPIKKICIENPQGYPNSFFRKPDQTIHPYYFGDDALKRTCLWLKNLPKLKYSHSQTLFEEQTSVERPKPILVQARRGTGRIKNRYFTDMISSGPEQWKLRSKTFPSIANAMAEQWG